MLQYLDIAVNFMDQAKSVSHIYLDKKCDDYDFQVKFWWYGTKSICYEYGDYKYETCSEDSTGVEISGFEPSALDHIIA